MQEKGGAIWAFMGEGEPPLIPDFSFLTAPEPNRMCLRVTQMANWLQGLESSTDPAHTTFLHRRAPGIKSERSGTDVNAVRGTEPPAISTEDTSFGTRIYALHNSPNGRRYLRVNNYVYPSGSTASQSGADVAYQGRIYVPVDDFSHCRFEFFYSPSKPMDKERLRKNRAENVAPDNRHVRRPENRYLQDREEMKQRQLERHGAPFPVPGRLRHRDPGRDPGPHQGAARLERHRHHCGAPHAGARHQADRRKARKHRA